MGSVVGKVMEENFKKQQDFMEKNQEVMVNRRLSNSLPNDKFLDWSKLKAFADNKSNFNEKLNMCWEG